MPQRSSLPLRSFRYLATFSIPLGAWATFTDRLSWYWSVPVIAFGAIPVLELIIGRRKDHLTAEEEASLLADPLFDIWLYLLVPVQYALLLLFLRRVELGGLATSEFLGCIATMGLLCGIYGINVAHELGHRNRRWERDLARALLLTSLYMHFIIEHNRGHHRRVATPDDPASARFNETVYAFWLRSVVFSWVSAWGLERDRLQKTGSSIWTPKNEMLQALAWQGLLVLFILAVFGPVPVLAFLLAAVMGVLLLETVNYIEHYGLQRVPLTTGAYGRVLHAHSWNSDHLIGRIMLFELTRHSDHHWKASRKYQILSGHADAPELPTGYPGMMVLSLIPPLFFRLVHPGLRAVVEAHPTVRLAKAITS